MTENTELAIIGAGIAGVSSAIYAQRSGIKFCLFEPKAVGGQLLFMENIDNYVGLTLETKGKDLAASLNKTLTDLNIPVIDEAVDKVELEKNGAIIYAGDSIYRVKGIIIATGASFKKLAIKGEEEFLGKGVSYCAVCDGFFFRNKEVAVVGGGNSAVEEALYLSNIVRKVTLVHRRDRLRALNYLQKELLRKDNIEVMFNSVVNEARGSGFLEELVIEDVETKNKRILPLQGLFVSIGVKPNTETFKSLFSTDEDGFILTDEQMKTSCDLIWAAGDCRRRPLRQLITAASEGAIAAISAYRHLKGQYISY